MRKKDFKTQNQKVGDMIKLKNILEDNKKRIPRKKGQHRGSSSHSDLYTDENPKGTIKGLKFANTMLRNQ